MVSKAQKKKAYEFGIFAEMLTILMLFLKGYRILVNRYKTKFGEIDIIAVKSGIVVFIEVKGRVNKNAFELVTTNQQKRICKTAALFIAKNSKFANLHKRFDVVVVNPFKWPKHIVQAWDYIE